MYGQSLRNKYFVIKITDVRKYLNKQMQEQLFTVLAEIEHKRGMEGKMPLEGLFIRDTDPNYNTILNQTFSMEEEG